MKKLLLIVLLALLPIAYAEDVYNSQGSIIGLEISSYVKIIPGSSDYSLKWLTANLSLYPKDSFNQKVLSLKTEPSAELSDASAQFRWNNPDDDVSLKLISQIKTSNTQNKIKAKVKNCY